jgi:hypothetical protein
MKYQLTVFTSGLTEEEFQRLFAPTLNREDFEDRYHASRSQDDFHFDLCRLYAMRGNKKMAKEFYEKIENQNYRNTIVQLGLVSRHGSRF